jgi:hypothetical protein
MFLINKGTHILGLLILAAFVFPSSVHASGEGEPLETYMELVSWKYAKDSRVLVASISAEDDSGEIPVPGAAVDFYILTDTAEIKLGSVITDRRGKAKLAIGPSVSLPMNEEGYLTFMSQFNGNESFAYSESELAIMDAWIDISFFMEDSIKMIRFKGGVIGPDGSESPLADNDIYLYVPRMFNLMIIEEGWLEEDGQGTAEFPTDLIGDSTGMVTVIARIEEHYDYGNLEASANIKWALPKHSEKREGPVRELWSPIAPLWMIITLIIMLAGVWGHYIYAIIQLYMIKKAGRNQ